MKKLSLITIALLAVGLVNCSKEAYTPPIKEIVYVPVKDTVNDRANEARICYLTHELNMTRDSLNIIKDSIGDDLAIARMKLYRIKRYNELAAKGNNITFLRGWINRTLNDL